MKRHLLASVGLCSVLGLAACGGPAHSEAGEPDVGIAQQDLEYCNPDRPEDCPAGYGVCMNHTCYPCKVFPQYCAWPE